jgi:hypothetical protein
METAIEIAVRERPHIRFADRANEARRQLLAAAQPEREQNRARGIKR